MRAIMNRSGFPLPPYYGDFSCGKTIETSPRTSLFDERPPIENAIDTRRRGLADGSRIRARASLTHLFMSVEPVVKLASAFP